MPTPKIPAVPKPKPPTIKDMFAALIARPFLTDETFRHFRDVLESVATESGKIYNHFVSSENRRERQLEGKIENLEQENRFLRQQMEQVIRANHFLRGRGMTLEQVAKIEPLTPRPDDGNYSPPEFKPAHEFNPFPR